MWSCLTSCRKSSGAKSPNSQVVSYDDTPANSTTRIIDLDHVLGGRTHPVQIPIHKLTPVRHDNISASSSHGYTPSANLGGFGLFEYIVSAIKYSENAKQQAEAADDDTYTPKPDSPVRHHHIPSSDDNHNCHNHHTPSYDNYHHYSPSYESHHTSSSYDNHHTSSNDYGSSSTSYDNNTTSHDYGGSSSNDYGGGCSTSYD